MSQHYTHLSLEQRYQIEALVKVGKKQCEIAQLIGKSKSCISRELKRGIPLGGVGAFRYSASNAQRKTDLKHYQKPKRKVFDNRMKEFCRDRLINDRWSPELISHEGKKIDDNFISHEWIYQWIWNCKKGNRLADRHDKFLYRYLKHGRRRRKRGNRRDLRGNIPGRISIELRPKIVNKKKRIGDIEVDLMIGKNHQSSLLVCLDRATLHTRLRLLKSKSSADVTRALKKVYTGNWIKTFTFDNDQAFTNHQQIADVYNAQTFFTRPYTSQDKGSVENRIGQIRRFLPKKTDLNSMTPQQIYSIQTKINNRPIRKFNYKTANQVFSEKIALTS
jgi:IS30 family transposase